jgi:hypothetical protein
MATRTLSTPPDNNTDANFRLWINEIHNALIAFGWVQTSDTGQINFSTVTRPTTTLVYPGYAMYKMGDAIQTAGCPCFMRIDFGTGANTDNPSVKVQVGVGGTTDGAGAFSGCNTSTLVQNNPSGTQANGSTTPQNMRTSGDSSSFRMHCWSTNNSNQGWTFIIERDRDTSGANTALGVCLIFCFPDSNISSDHPVCQFLSATVGEVWTQETRWYALLSAASSQSSGGNIGMGPVRVPAGPFRNPMLGCLLTSRGDFTVETTTTVTIYGSSHTYLMLRPDQGSSNRALNTWNADPGIAMLWE